MNTALVLIATGTEYQKYVRPLLASAQRFFVPHKAILFTDCATDYGVTSFPHRDLGYPLATLSRYHTFLKQKEYLSQFDYIFYSDIDMLFVDEVGAEIFSDGLTATQHAGYVDRGHVNSPTERNPKSTAFLPRVDQYYCGGFNGGTSYSFLRMAETIRSNVNADLQNGIIAEWHDESHLNKYLAHNPPSVVLPPSYCYPETNLSHYRERVWLKEYEPKLVALDKGSRSSTPRANACTRPLCAKKVFASIQALAGTL